METPRIARALLIALTLATACRCQAEDLEAREARLARSAARELLRYAQTAASNKQEARAHDASRLIVERYDPDHHAARKILGHVRQKDAWEAPAPEDAPLPVNAGTAKQRRRVKKAWAGTAAKLAALHRDLGIALREQDQERSEHHLLRAVAYDPTDRAAHVALGHRERDGFFGSDEDLRFLERFEEIEEMALKIATRDESVKQLPPHDLPEPLLATGLEFTGARTSHVELWSRFGQERTTELAQWGERAYRFLEFLLEGQEEHRSELLLNQRRLAWITFLDGPEERDLFLANNAHLLGENTPADIARFKGYRFVVSNKNAEVSWDRRESYEDDVVSTVVQRCFAGQGNAGLGAGLVHAVSWFLLGTTKTYFGSLPTTESDSRANQDADPVTCLDELRDEIREGSDWPLNQIPRERLSSFRASVRIKSWWFMVWLLARHPDRWADLTRAFPETKIPLPEACEAIFEKVLRRDFDAIDAEWRHWARGDTAIARASKHGSGRDD